MALKFRRIPAVLVCSLMVLAAQRSLRADDGQTWETETLSNGLRVIYAPMPNSPTTHVRVLYHVGSRDERSDRQGFAHMFEHMMFRGSAHVAPQEHMKMIGLVGGYSNAFTSFDKTVYVNTIPASYTDLALWLEADRMSSFKVSPQIFYTERLVVAEEWRLRISKPYGTMFDELMADEFNVHPYHWTPIGNMQHLQAASAGELQEFFNKYYVPNNAILSIAGKIDVAKIKQQVHQYFGWIPSRGVAPSSSHTGMVPATELAIARNIPEEPTQTEPRRFEINMRVPLTRILVTYHMPPAASDDNDPLGLLLSILGDGQSSRLSRALVTNKDPLCVDADTLAEGLEDGGVMGAEGLVLQGKDPAAVEKILREQVASIRDNLVTPEELEKVKQQQRLALAQRFETAEKVATDLGDEMLTYGNTDRVKTERARLEAITPADIQRVAKKYLPDAGATVLVIHPGTPAPAASQSAPPAAATQSSTTAPAVQFPADYPTQAPMTGNLPAATFEKGVETTMGNPTAATKFPHLIVMEDHRMPIVNWTISIRSGSYAEPAGKEGLGNMTAEMVRRGPKGKTFDQFNEELESRTISLDVTDGGDYTRISGSCLKEDLPKALAATRDILTDPAFDPGEFDNLKDQTINSLRLSLNNPQTVAGRVLNHELFGDSPVGRLITVASLKSLTLADVKKFYASIYASPDAVIMISGDISVPDGQKAAETYFGAWAADTRKPDGFEIQLPPAPKSRRIILVDNPDGKQSSISIGTTSYTIQSAAKFAGTLTGQMLSSGIDSRLGKYVRAEKGYVYGVTGYFQPNRNAGAFISQADTKFTTTADTVEAIFKVFNDLKAAPVPDKELADAKFRVAGQMLMTMETVSDQATRRVEGVLNGYPIDYYDDYAQASSRAVGASEINKLANQYIEPDRMIVVVVAPASAVKTQLERLGTVEVVPMPATE